MSVDSRWRLWNEFLTAWPVERVRRMSMDEYTNLERDSAFIYWIEKRLEDLGSIWGGSAFKFGIYRRQDTEIKPEARGRTYGDEYAWQTRLGRTKEEAFAVVRARLVEVIDAARAGNIALIDEVDLAPVLKWKVAFLYQDREHPGILPIYKHEALFHHYRKINPSAKSRSTPYSVMYATLMEEHADEGDVFEIGRMLWNQYETERERAPRAWAVPLAWTLPSREEIDALSSKVRVEPEDVSPFLENLLASADTAEGDYVVLLDHGDVCAVGTLTGTEPGEYAWRQTPARFPANLLVNPTSEVVELRADEWNRIREQIEGRQPLAPKGAAMDDPRPEATPEVPPAPSYPNNIILYGPPGTGKTHSTMRRALELILGEDVVGGWGEKGLVTQFRELQLKGRIEFVTFHQSYGYEEFVEGIRPVLGGEESTDVRYELHDGVFKRIALRAAAEGLRSQVAEAPSFDELWNRLLQELREEDGRVVHSPSGKTYLIKPNEQGSIISYRCEVDEEGNVTEITDKQQTASKRNSQLLWDRRAELGPEPESITSTKTTELFVRERGGTGGHHYTPLWMVYTQLFALSREPGARKQGLVDPTTRVQQALDKPTAGGASFSFSAATPQYVLIIDEINRGNMSKILGELITLLDPEKRLGAPGELKIPLSYSPNHRFAVPPNLHVLGTMNTADRSIALMDVALRRRFTFEEMMPDASVIREVLRNKAMDAAFIDLVTYLFGTLNGRIRFLYDRDHQLGHSYFLGAEDYDGLRQIFVDRIIPLLQEYFYGAWDKICAVLGCPYSESGEPRRGAHLVTRQNGRRVYVAPLVHARPFSELQALGFDHDDHEDRIDYVVNERFRTGAMSTEELQRAFLGILELPEEEFQRRLTDLQASDPGAEESAAEQPDADEDA